jgi:hypothetical protein
MILNAADAAVGEVGRGPGQETGAGGALLVGQDLGVGQPGVVVDQGVHVVEPDGWLLDPGLVVDRAAQARQPPLAGIFPSLFTSMCTSWPGRSRS